MYYEPAHVLLIAVAAALALPEPGRWNPFRLARSSAPLFAKDLPHTGPWAIPGGVLLLALIAALATAAVRVLIVAMPLWLQLVMGDNARRLGLVLSALLLRLCLGLPPLWAGGRWRRRTADGSAAYCALEIAAPVLIFALLGIHAAVIYRATLETAAGLCRQPQYAALAAPALWLIYIPAAPARRLVLLLFALASRAQQTGDGCAFGAPTAAVLALALLVAAW